MNNYTQLLDMCEMYNDILTSAESLDVTYRETQAVSEALAAVHEIMIDLQTFGYNDITISKFKKNDILMNCDKAKLCLKYKSVEGLSAESIKEGFIKFFDKVAEFIKKAIIWVRNLFDKTAYKCKAVLKNRSAILMDKPVSAIIPRDNLGRIIAGTDAVGNAVKELKIEVSANSVKCKAVTGDYLKALAAHSNNIIGVDTLDRICWGTDDLFKTMKDVTLEGAGYQINDPAVLCEAYLKREKTYTDAGAAFIADVGNRAKYNLGISTFDDSRKATSLRMAINARVSLYKMLLDTQKEVSKCINQFYFCIDKAVIDV